MLSRKLDMTKGSITKLAFLFSLPLVLGNILQQLYTTVDTLVVGNYCGTNSMAAVGTSSQPIEVLLCIFMGIGGGVSILVSQAAGQKNNERIHKLASTAIFFLYITAIPLTIIGFFAGPYILKLMQVPEETLDLATQYIRIVLFGTLGLMGYNMNAGILRGLGDSNSSLYFLIASCLMNIILDLLFVVFFKMDVSGVAWATTIAQFFSWLLTIVYIKKRYPELKFPFFPKKAEGKVLGEIIKLGLPLGLNHSLYSFGHLMMQSLINTQGAVFMAACSVATRITGIANVAINALSSSGLTFAGQNYGAKNYQRLKKGGIYIPLLSGAISLTFGIILTIWCYPILRIFNKDEAVLSFAVLYIRIVLPATWTYAIFNGIINIANGMGAVRYSTVVNILMLWAVRLPAAFLIKQYIGGTYIMAGISISFIFGMICMLFFYRSKKWKEISSAGATAS
ncbi:MAG: MATE family efflux transporter [Treponemataceae bacterium]|nr:MATE family efflux transporter [Treponemataceae bacterium]